MSSGEVTSVERATLRYHASRCSPSAARRSAIRNPACSTRRSTRVRDVAVHGHLVVADAHQPCRQRGRGVGPESASAARGHRAISSPHRSPSVDNPNHDVDDPNHAVDDPNHACRYRRVAWPPRRCRRRRQVSLEALEDLLRPQHLLVPVAGDVRISMPPSQHRSVIGEEDRTVLRDPSGGVGRNAHHATVLRGTSGWLTVDNPYR